MQTKREKIRRKYIESMRSKIAALGAFRNELVSGRVTPDTFDGLRRMAHNLRGSGGSFGFPEVSDAAGRLEDADKQQVLAELENTIVVLGAIADVGAQVDPLTILVVEDEPDTQALIVDLMTEPGRTVIFTSTLQAARAQLEQLRPDLVILDLVLPDGDGRDLLAELQETSAAPPLVIVLSACADTPSRTECLALGAAEFMPKPFDVQLLSATVSARLAEYHSHNDAVQTDRLTGLANRSGLEFGFHRAAAMSQRTGAPSCVAFIDVDGFKQVNDVLGHRSGDALLQFIANKLVEDLRAADLVARWGGDEFVVLMPETEAAEAGAAFAHVRACLNADSPPDWADVSLSIGVVEVYGAVPLADCISSADALMYQAKRAGGGRTVFEEPLANSAVKALYVEDDEPTGLLVKSVLEQHGISVDIAADAIVGRAALSKGTYDLLVLDVDLGETSGYDVLEVLPGLPVRPAILVLTALGSDEDIREAFRNGASDYVQKPFEPANLAARVRKILSAARMRRFNTSRAQTAV